MKNKFIIFLLIAVTIFNLTACTNNVQNKSENASTMMLKRLIIIIEELEDIPPRNIKV